MLFDDKITIVSSAGTALAGNVFDSKVEYPEYLIEDEDGNRIAFYSMEELSVTNTTSIPAEPIEQGSWASYNRVIEPLEVTATLVLEGEDSTIQDALDALDELCEGDKKVKFIIPVATYENLMMQTYDYRKDSHTGHNVLRVNVKLVEIREVASQQTTTSVNEPPPPPEVSEGASADGSCVSTETYGETPTYTPTQQEETQANKSNESLLHQGLGTIW
jgi:hypothetical protein